MHTKNYSRNINIYKWYNNIKINNKNDKKQGLQDNILNLCICPKLIIL